MNTSEGERAIAIVRKFSTLTFATARTSPQVSGLAKADPQVGRDTVKALANMLIYTANQFNVGKNINNVQLAVLSNDLLRTYWHWRFDEFAYVLGQAVRGKYGPVYDRIDAATINEWCEKYAVERDALVEQEGVEQAKAYRLAELNKQPPPQFTNSPEALAIRQHLETLSDETLQQGLDYYTALATPNPTQALKLEIATQVAQARNANAWIAHMLKNFKPGAGKTWAEREAEAKAETKRIKLALLSGDWKAAGLTGPPPTVSSYELTVECTCDNVPDNQTCPHCLDTGRRAA